MAMVALLCLLLVLFASPFKLKSRLEAQCVPLRYQLAVLRRKVQGRVQFANGDRLFFVQLLSMVSSNPIRDRDQALWCRSYTPTPGHGHP